MGIDHYAYMTYGTVQEYDEAFFEIYDQSTIDSDKLPVVFDPMFGEMHIGLVLFQSGSIEDSGENVKNMVVDPENVGGLLKMRDQYKLEFTKTFPDYESLLEGKWRIRSFVFMCA